MRLFYTHLLSGKTRSEALTQAKRDLRTQHDKYRHPYYWAAFTLRGVWD